MQTTHSTTSPTPSRGHHGLPADPLGWVALVLLLVVIAVPAWWGALQNVVDTGLAMTVIAVVLGVSAFTTGGVAVRRDEGVVLRVALALAAMMTAVGLMVLVGFAFGER